jgi:hypothetical protein
MFKHPLFLVVAGLQHPVHPALYCDEYGIGVPRLRMGEQWCNPLCRYSFEHRTSCLNTLLRSLATLLA